MIAAFTIDDVDAAVAIVVAAKAVAMPVAISVTLDPI